MGMFHKAFYLFHGEFCRLVDDSETDDRLADIMEQSADPDLYDPVAAVAQTHRER